MQFALPIMLANISYHKTKADKNTIEKALDLSLFRYIIDIENLIMIVASRLNTVSIAAKTKHYKNQIMLADSPAGHVLAYVLHY
jgi:hypothetical protein